MEGGRVERGWEGEDDSCGGGTGTSEWRRMENEATQLSVVQSFKPVCVWRAPA